LRQCIRWAGRLVANCIFVIVPCVNEDSSIQQMRMIQLLDHQIVLPADIFRFTTWMSDPWTKSVLQL
jgi:hypothetical protein